MQITRKKIKTPMSGIIGFSELLEEEDDKEKKKEYIDSIKTASKNLLTLFDDILELSKITTINYEITEPTIIIYLFLEINDIYSHKAKKANLSFIINIDEKLPHKLFIDEEKLKQILFKLLDNAFKFTPKGFVKLNVHYTSNPDSTINLIMEVIDSGIGINEEYHQKIFELFNQKDNSATRRYGGAGLGLTISKRLAEMMNGKIEVESKEGKGSTFRVTIPNIKTFQNI